MKKICLIIIFIVCSARLSDGETHRITLRAAHHPVFFRIVVEGPEPLISGAIVNQRGDNIQVSFPGFTFDVEDEKMNVAYKKIADDTILFLPLEFRGFKVFTLKQPSRLVIDVFLRKGEKQAERRERERMKGEAGIGKAVEREIEKKKLSGIMSIVIDSGHGGYEYGISNGDYIEKNVVLDIAKKLKSRINVGKTQCEMTRRSDRFLGLDKRAQITNETETEVFLSLHVGSLDRIVMYVPYIAESVPDMIKPYVVNRGQDQFVSESLILMESMKQSFESEFGTDMVSVKSLPYSLLSKIEAAAVMIEFPSFEAAYYGDEFRTDIVNTIHKGIYLYEEKTSRWD